MEDKVLQDLFVSYLESINQRNYDQAAKIKIAMNSRKNEIANLEKADNLKKIAASVAVSIKKTASKAYEAIEAGLDKSKVLAYLEETLEDRKIAVDFVQGSCDNKVPFQLRQFVVCNSAMEEEAEELKLTKETMLAFAASCEETSEFIERNCSG